MIYKHTPLSNESQTRLLDLDPAADESEPLSGTLKMCEIRSNGTTQVRSSCQFEALSYVWGPPSSTHTIAIGKAYLPITANCDAALRQLRRSSAQRTLWIDSICIDQTDVGTKERNSQVAMMGDIYSSNDNVLIWLGESDEKTTALLQHLKRLYGYRDDTWEDVRNDICQKFMTMCDQKWNTPTQEIIEGLLSRTWFERMWTLQELLLARTAVVLCGDQSMEWKSLCESLNLVQASFSVSSKGMRNFANCYHASLDFEDLMDEVTSAPAPAQGTEFLSKLVHNSRIRHATDPKDKIFALYGLSLSGRKPLPLPDYTQTVSEVYSQGAIAIMQSDQSLWVLDNVWSENRRDDLPSWVPDWSDDYRWSDDKLSELGKTPLDPGDRDIPSHWDGPLEQETLLINPSMDCKRLELTARALGNVNRVFEDMERIQAQNDALAAPRGTLQYELALRRHGSETVKMFRQVFASTANDSKSEVQLCRLLLTITPTQPEEAFMAGIQALRCIFTTGASSKNQQYIFDRARRSCMNRPDDERRNPDVLAYIGSNFDAALDMVLLGSLSQETWQEELCDRELWLSLQPGSALYRLVRGLWIDRSMFTTDTGLLGYAHGHVCPRDKVVKFTGAPSPSVVRSLQGEFQLLSPAVVKGKGNIMAIFARSLLERFVLI